MSDTTGKRVLALMASMVEATSTAESSPIGAAAPDEACFDVDLNLLEKLVAEPFNADAALERLVADAHQDRS